MTLGFEPGYPLKDSFLEAYENTHISVSKGQIERVQETVRWINQNLFFGIGDNSSQIETLRGINAAMNDVRDRVVL